MKILVSACLLGRNCKYNGGNNYCPTVIEYVKNHQVIPVCPEVLAGLGTPRIPVEIVDSEVKTKDGHSVDNALRQAVAQILKEHRDIDCAILKSRSPTCGVKQVYDGTFTGTLRDGSGILAQALIDAGVNVIDSEDIK